MKLCLVYIAILYEMFAFFWFVFSRQQPKPGTFPILDFCEKLINTVTYLSFNEIVALAIIPLLTGLIACICLIVIGKKHRLRAGLLLPK